MKKRPAAVVAVLVTLSIGTAATLWSRQPKKEPPVQTKEVLSEVYHVDQIYRSMKGPSSQQVVYLGDPEHPELVWVVGYDATMVTPDGETTLPQEYMCHSNLDIDPRRHAAELDSSKAISGRLFTLSQGQLEIDLPKGFGIPMMSDEPLVLTTQVLNLNHEDADLEVRHRVRVRYIRNADLKKPMKPLFPTAAYGLEVIGDEPAHFGRMEGDDAMGEGCLPGENAAEHAYRDPFGRIFTGHWVVKPGREVNETLVTEVLNLPYDTTVHYIAVHLHPFAESLELRDLTTDRTVFKSHVRPADEGIGIDHVEYFSSKDGVLLHRDHEYQLVSVYNNTSGEDQDSMAVMYMYLYDKDFTMPANPDGDADTDAVAEDAVSK